MVEKLGKGVDGPASVKVAHLDGDVPGEDADGLGSDRSNRPLLIFRKLLKHLVDALRNADLDLAGWCSFLVGWHVLKSLGMVPN